jgi:hypothetical protein
VRHSNDHKNIGREHEQEWECDKVKGVEENELCQPGRENASVSEMQICVSFYNNIAYVAPDSIP